MGPIGLTLALPHVMYCTRLFAAPWLCSRQPKAPPTTTYDLRPNLLCHAGHGARARVRPGRRAGRACHPKAALQQPFQQQGKQLVREDYFTTSTFVDKRLLQDQHLRVLLSSSREAGAGKCKVGHGLGQFRFVFCGIFCRLCSRLSDSGFGIYLPRRAKVVWHRICKLPQSVLEGRAC